MSDEQASVGEQLDATFRRQDDELDMLREALRQERATSDFLWDRALQRGMITEEEWVIARDPDGPRHRQEAMIVKQNAQDLPGG
jgi:hypothetical protein